MEQYDFLRCSATYLQKVLYRDDRFILYNCESACSLGHSLECISTRQLFQSRLNFLSNPEVDPSEGALQEQANADRSNKTSVLLGLLREARCAMNLRRLLCDELAVEHNLCSVQSDEAKYKGYSFNSP